MDVKKHVFEEIVKLLTGNEKYQAESVPDMVVLETGIDFNTIAMNKYNNSLQCGFQDAPYVEIDRQKYLEFYLRFRVFRGRTVLSVCGSWFWEGNPSQIRYSSKSYSHLTRTEQVRIEALYDFVLSNLI